jgi:hypothetical protein
LLVIGINGFMTGCSGNKPEQTKLLFYGEGENWVAVYKKDSAQLSGGKAIFNFMYKGNVIELIQSKE